MNRRHKLNHLHNHTRDTMRHKLNHLHNHTITTSHTCKGTHVCMFVLNATCHANPQNVSQTCKGLDPTQHCASIQSNGISIRHHQTLHRDGAHACGDKPLLARDVEHSPHGYKSARLHGMQCLELCAQLLQIQTVLAKQLAQHLHRFLFSPAGCTCSMLYIVTSGESLPARAHASSDAMISHWKQMPVWAGIFIGIVMSPSFTFASEQTAPPCHWKSIALASST